MEKTGAFFLEKRWLRDKKTCFEDEEAATERSNKTADCLAGCTSQEEINALKGNRVTHSTCSRRVKARDGHVKPGQTT